MSEIKDVRAALEKLKKRQKDADGHIVDFRSGPAAEWFGHGTAVASAFVSEGLAACETYLKESVRCNRNEGESCDICQRNDARLGVYDDILRKAGLL